MLCGGSKTTMSSVIERTEGIEAANTHENTIGIVFLLGNSCGKLSFQMNESPICRGLRMGLGTGSCLGVTGSAHRRSTVSPDNEPHQSGSFSKNVFSGFSVQSSTLDLSGNVLSVDGYPVGLLSLRTLPATSGSFGRINIRNLLDGEKVNG